MMNAPLSELKSVHLLRQAFLASFAVGLEPVAELIDTAICGQVSTQWVAAIALTNTLLGSMIFAFNFFAQSLMARLSQALGSDSLSLIRSRLLSTLMFVSFLGALIAAALSLAFGSIVPWVFSVDLEMLSLMEPYWHARVIGLPFALLCSCQLSALRGLGYLKVAAGNLLVVVLWNAIGSYLSAHVFGFGLLGVAVSTSSSLIVGFLCSLIFLINRGYLRFDFKWIEIKKGFNLVGVDSVLLSIRSFSIMAAFFVAMKVVSKQDAPVIAAYQIGLQVWLFASYLLDGLAVVATFHTGQAVGRGTKEQISALWWRINSLAFAVGIGLAAFYFFAATYIFDFFTSDPAVIKQLALFWIIIVLAQPMNAMVYTMDGFNFGLGEFKKSAWVMAVLVGAIFIPSLWFLSWFHLTLNGVWLVFFFFSFLRLVLGAGIYFRNVQSKR